MTGRSPASTPSPGPLDGVLNVRDLGGTTTRSGHRLRPGHLLRGASLSSATDTDVATLRASGVADVVDLRAPWEQAEAGPVPTAFTVHRIPLVTDHDRARSHDVLRRGGLVGYSTWLVDRAGDRLVEVVEVVGSADRGVLVQCGAGKDRTGLAIALLLDLLDVPDEAIVADYAATNAALRALGTALARTPGYERSLADLPKEVLRAPPEVMTRILADLRDGATVADRLADHGLTAEHVTRLRDRLLDEPA